VTFLTNSAITEQDPTVTGVVTSYTISPSLPAGLNFNTTTGAITGTPTVNSAATTYTVTATNAAGSTTCHIVISVGNNRYVVASGNWNSTSTWSLASGGVSGAPVPVSGDLVFIGEAATSYTVTIPSGYAAACGSLTMGNYSAATVATLTFTDGTSLLAVGNDLVMNRPNAAATSVINVNAGSLTVGDTLKLAYSDLTPDASATLINRVNISTGTVTTGNLLFNGQSAAQSQVVFSGAGTLNISGNLTFGYILGTLTPSTGTVNFNGTAAQTIPVGVSSVIYNNLTINNTNAVGATINAAITGTNVTGNLSVGNITSGSTFDNGGYAIVLASGKSLNIANGSTFSLSGTSGMVTVSGGGTKTFGITSTVNYSGTAQTVSAETYGHLTLSGSGTKTLPATTTTVAGNFTMSGTASTTALAAINTTGNFTLGSGTTFNASTFTHIVGGNWANNGTFTPSTGTVNFSGTTAMSGSSINSFNNIAITGTLTAPASANINVAGNFSNSGTFTNNGGTITFNGTGAQTINSGGSSFNNLTITNTGATCTASTNNITVAGAFTTNAGTTLDMSTKDLSVSTVSHSGTLLTQSTSATPITTGKTWGGTVQYNASSAQTVAKGFYNNITLSGAAGATAENDITVNGILNLSNYNPSTIKGLLDMNTYTLNMGASATTTGMGDVTGIVKRQHTFTNGVQYSFGNQYTTINFIGVSGGTKPNWITCKIVIGSTPSWRSGSILRYYTFISDVNATDNVIPNLHYLPGELNGNTASNIVLWDDTGTFTCGSSTINFNSTTSGKTIAGTLTGSTGKFNNIIFNGSGGAWNFSDDAEVANNFTITNGSVTAAPNSNLTVAGNFTNNGSFTHNNGKVLFNGNTHYNGSSSTNFYNVDVPAGKLLTIDGGGNTMRVSNTIRLLTTDPHNMAQLAIGDNASKLIGTGNNDVVNVQIYDTLNNWHYQAAPLYNGYLGAMALRYYYGKSFNETTNAYVTVTGYDSLQVGKGYAIKFNPTLLNESKRLTTFAGTISKLHTGTITLPVTNTEGEGGGWNLVGNPYPCLIDWDATNGWLNTNIDPTVYVYDSQHQSYTTYNSTSHTGTNGGTRYIPSMQGLYVHCTANGVWSMDNRVRVAYNQPFWKGAAENASDKTNQLSILINGNNFSDESVIAFANEATNGFDAMIDAYKLFSPEENVPQINTKTLENNSVKVAVNNLPISKMYNSIVPVEITTGVAGKYTITANNLTIDPTVEVTLEDLKTKTFTDLRSSSYTFTSDAVSNENRFNVLFGSRPTAIKEINTENFSIYTDHSQIVIKNNLGSTEKSLVIVYDILGKQITERNLDPNTTSTLEMNESTAQSIYFVKVVTENKTFTKKICMIR